MTAPLRIALCCLWAVSASAALLPLVEEPGLSGSYEDTGAGVAGTAATPAGEVSLHALLNLEFDPARARALHERTARIVIAQSKETLSIRVYDSDDKVTREEEWKLGKGYAREGNRALLRLPATSAAREEYLLILQSVAQGRLLQVEVHRITPTTFGPAYRSAGTYVFARME
jgi:hypothetical protein